MQETVRHSVTGDICRRSLGAVLVALLGLAVGCQGTAPPTPAPEKPRAEGGVGSVRVAKPERKTVRRPIEQPGFNIEAFEETALYPRISGFVGKWTVDLGDPVKKDQVLAELDVPEMMVD